MATPMTPHAEASTPTRAAVKDLVLATLHLLDSEALTGEQRAKAEEIYSLASGLEDEFFP